MSHCQSLRAQEVERARGSRSAFMTPNPEENAATPFAETPVSEAALVVIDPNGRRLRVPLFPFPFRMGRAPDNNLVLRDTRVSRNHAQIARNDGHYILEDLGSRHGVWVNAERVEKSRRLEGSERMSSSSPTGIRFIHADGR